MAMEKLIWKDAFNTGISTVDMQHHKLIEMLNRIIEAYGYVTTDSDIISELLSDMTRYAMVHFETEEVLMEKHGYPGLETHKREHLAFIKETAKLCTKTTEGADSVPKEALEFLRTWWQNHILKTDMSFSPYLLSKGCR